MSARKNKPDTSDYAEATLQAATTAAEALRKSSARKLAGAFLKRANPVEGALTAWESVQLIPGFRLHDSVERAEAERAKAAAEVEAMALDPNVTQVDRFVKGFADPVRTGYGIVKGVQRLRQNMADRDKSRDAYSELLDRGASEEMKRALKVMGRAKETNKQSSIAAAKHKRALLRRAAKGATEK